MSTGTDSHEPHARPRRPHGARHSHQAPQTQAPQEAPREKGLIHAPGTRAAVGGWFLRKFLRSPRSVASLWPSSRYLARAMVRGLELPPGMAVIELGPGTGPFTDALAHHLGPRGDYLGIDRDPEFIELLRGRHPRFDFVQADVFDLGRLLDERPHLAPFAVLSGLPLVLMPRPAVLGLLETVRDRLPPTGVFRTFSYVQSLASPNAWWLRRSMKSLFPHFKVYGPVWRNVMPAFVLEGRK